MVLYPAHHEQQTARSNSAITRRAGCTWTSGATGADAATGGRKDRTPDYIHGLVRNSEETNPTTPGWSLPDLALAMKRLGVPFEVRSGQGFAAVERAHAAGLFVVLQGDSDRFPDNSCSGAFEGDHCIGIRPADSGGRWLIDDPICDSARYESPAVLAAYARKLYVNVLFGVFLDKVPQIPLRWSASVSPVPPAEERRFFTYTVRNAHQKPLLIETRQTNLTRGFTAACTAPVHCRAGAFDGTPPAALVRLTSGARKGQYIDGRFAVET